MLFFAGMFWVKVWFLLWGCFGGSGCVGVGWECCYSACQSAQKAKELTTLFEPGWEKYYGCGVFLAGGWVWVGGWVKKWNIG